MLFKKSKVISAIIIFMLTLIVIPFPSVLAAASAEVENKSEVIYASLSSEGESIAAYIINRFEVQKSGLITDYGSYASAINLTDTNALTRQNGYVTFEASKGIFYYQGNIESPDLPWVFDISYTLDGVSVSPESLAGKTGQIKIHITSQMNTKVDAAFCDNYLLQISATMNSDRCSNITSEGGNIAIAGNSMVISHTILPGDNADITIHASVNDFEMTGIDISAIPYSMNIELPDTDDMISDFKTLTDAISELNSGIGDLEDGVAEMNSGAKLLKNGSADINSGLSQLSANGTQIVAASSQFNTALAQISASLSGISPDDFSLASLIGLPDALTQMVTGLSDISTGLIDLKNTFQSTFDTLDAAIVSIPDTTISSSQIDELYTLTDPSQHNVLDELVAYYQAGQTVKGTYSSAKDVFIAVTATIDALSANIDNIAYSLNTIATGIEATLADGGLDQMGTLITGLDTLSQNYSDFHNGLKTFMSGLTNLSIGYTSYNSGLSMFCSGVNDLYAGIVQLHSGTQKMKNETSDLPDTIQSEIDDMLAKYSGSDFEPVSFTSPQNRNIALVQFVFKCDDIKKPKTAADTTIAQSDETIVNRLFALFDMKEK